MTKNLEDQLIRDVLAHEAGRHDVPGYDPAEVVLGARARRRRRRAMVGGAAMALVVVAGAVALAAGGLANNADRQMVPQGTLHRVSDGESASAPMIPYCQPRTGDMTSELLHVDGVAFATACDWYPDRRYLWYHAGRTVMSSGLTGLQVLVGDRLVQLSDAAPVQPRISMDGRYLAWFEQDAFVVHDLVAGRPAGRFTVPDQVLSAVVEELEGMDWSGRSYVQADGSLWVHDLGGSRWSEVRGLPQDWGGGDWKQLAYLTPEGFAVESEELAADEPGARSIEGRVTQGGVFEPVRTVPLGRAVWSPDRSHAVQLSGEGFTAHPAEDLGTQVLLDVPVDPADVPAVAWDAQWESGSTVLVTWAVTHGPAGAVSPDAFVTYRCFAPTGYCSMLPREIEVPHSALADPGG